MIEISPSVHFKLDWKILMKGGTISNWQKHTRWSVWFFSSPQFIIFNYLAQDVTLILTLQSGLLSHTDSECQTYQETKNFPYSAPSDKGTIFFHSHMNGALQHHHPMALKASALVQNLPLPGVTFGHMVKPPLCNKALWNTRCHLQNTFQSKWLCNTLLELNSMTLVQIMQA